MKSISSLKNGDHCCLDTFEESGAVVYRCNDMYLLFEVPRYGGPEVYEGTYFENQKSDIISKILNWT